MERLLKFYDECDDLLDVVRVHSRPALVTAALLAAFLLVVGGVFLFGPADLLAAP